MSPLRPRAPTSPRPSPATISPRLSRLLALGALLPPLGIFALGGYAVYQSRQQTEQRTELLTQNLANAIDRGVSANIEKIDLALNAIVDRLEDQLATGALDLRATSGFIHAQANEHVELEGIRVTDAQGRGFLGPSLSPQSTVSFADREWFTMQRDHPDLGLHMSRPLVSRLDHSWIVSFSRRYRNHDGSFGGVVTAAVPLSYFHRQVAAIDVGARGLVALRSADLGLITRHPEPASGRGGEIGGRNVSPELRDLVASGEMQGTFHALATADGVERTGTFRRLSVVPMIVVVGLAADDYLADWRRERGIVGSACIAVTLLYGLAGLSWRRAQAQRRAAHQRIDLLAKAFEHSCEAILITDANNLIVEVNPAFTELTGYAAEEVIGRDPKLLASGRTPLAEYRAMWTALQASGHWRGEVWDRSKSGREYPQLMSISLVRDAQGRPVNYIASALDMTEVRESEQKILHLAHHDALTRLPNREYLHGRLQQALVTARREAEELAMLFIDMDRFKNINDTLGHHVGDGLLVEVGRRLRGIVRESDILARLGGDEFVLVLTGIGREAVHAASLVAAKVIDVLGQPYYVTGHELHSTPSIGIGIFPADGDDADTLMKNADTAMYHAKSAGRNNHQFFTPEMNHATAERLTLEVGLRTAIERGELLVHYQPQLDLRSGEIVAVEALVRWQHPELGLVPPLKFIPIAEDTGQIEAIGAWVLDQSLAQVARWRRSGARPAFRVAVNLSPQQLRGGDIAADVAAALERHGLPGDALELEITESTAMRDPARTARLLSQLRAHGVALAIDDFGTGYSSLAYLKQLPLSCLKLDRQFVMDIEHDPNDAAICTATVQMAHVLGLGVVAEGVETAAQLAFLRGLGCDFAQGYHISRPLPAEGCDRLFAMAGPARFPEGGPPTHDLSQEEAEVQTPE